MLTFRYICIYLCIYKALTIMKTKSDDNIILRIPKKIKTKFKDLCEVELTDISDKLKRYIISELRKNKKL